MPQHASSGRLALFFSLIVSVGCGQEPGSTSTVATASVAAGEGENRATLRPGTVVIDQTRDEWAERVQEQSWTLRAPDTALDVGDVVLLRDYALRITARSERDGQTVLGVQPATLDETFEQVTLRVPFDLSASPAATTVRSGEKAIGDPFALERRLDFPIAGEVVSGDLSLGLQGELGVSQVQQGDAGARVLQAYLQLTGDVTLALTASADGPGASESYEQLLTTLHYDLPLGVYDVGGLVGVSLAALDLPVYVGVGATLQSKGSVTVRGSYEIGARADYALGSELRLTPIEQASAEVTGDIPGLGPSAAARVGVAVGAYVRLLPQLRLLGGLAALGVDIKGGLHADGNASLFLDPPPYYCLSLQPSLQGELAGTFSATGLPAYRTDPLPIDQSLGDPVQSGYCGGPLPDAGMPETDAGAPAEPAPPILL